MADWAAIEADIEALLASDGFELVQLEVVTGRSARMTVFVDHQQPGQRVSVDDCAVVSRKVSGYLERTDPFNGPYHLQVSSPGFDRPLGKLDHCRRYVGRQVKLKCRREGKAVSVTGRLVAVEQEMLHVMVGDERQEVAWPTVTRANVVYEWDDEAPVCRQPEREEP